MEDMSFEQLMQRYEMGQAYIAITEAMGPSPQLVAFINYDKAHEDNCGLESLNIMDQHEAILSEIKSDPSMNMACESFGGRITSIMERVKNKITFNRHDNLNDFVQSKIAPKESRIYVAMHLHYDRALGYVDECIKALDYILPKIPHNSDVTAWTKFYEAYIAGPKAAEFSKHLQTIASNSLLFHDLGKQVDFAKSGWDEANFKKALKQMAVSQEQYHDRAATIATICQSMRNTLQLVRNSHAQQEWDHYDRAADISDSIENASKKKDDPTKKHWVTVSTEKALNEVERQARKKQHDLLTNMVPSHVITAMQRATTYVDEATTLIVRIERWMYKSAVDVSRHFELVG